MKLTDLFKKKKESENILTEPNQNIQNERLQKLWLNQAEFNIFTADQARALAYDRTRYLYLDTNVIKEILLNVKNAAARHNTHICGSIAGITLSNEEIEYCKQFLENAGYTEVNILNFANPNIFPKALQYSLTWS